ncbi:MAG: 30S ribosomal protein S16 [Ignavibacteriales bacterium]|nr:30S ribosomal protein S16 [Ignavibacteriales bacterium]
MVKLRLRRVGKKKQPVYKIVAAHSQSPRDGKFLEAIGTYHPRENPTGIEFKETRVIYWLKRGAQATETVLGLMKQKGLWLKWQLMKNGKDETAIAAEMENGILFMRQSWFERQRSASALAKRRKRNQKPKQRQPLRLPKHRQVNVCTSFQYFLE